MKRISKNELLAPAKNKECAFAAINCGADAIYIGAADFGARKNAGNSISDIKEIIEYAHKFNVKVYVTTNTLLFDNELEEAKKLIKELYEIQTDAIIVQDMGLLELDLPPISLHASTQCHNDSLEKVKFLERTGFERVVLARETPITEIQNICKNTNVEIECFIHGALCVSYSGQCYLSYAIGGRSANRGECAQPCRKKYSLIDKNGKIVSKDKHLLCLKDFNASEYIEKMIKCGVTSFKIEGRLKDVSYIKNVVSYYRQLIDKINKKYNIERSSFGESQINFVPDITKTFNRNYCDYFLSGERKSINSIDTPKHVGEFIGCVSEVKKNCFKIKGNVLAQNDGITFFIKNELTGTKIEKIIDGWFYPSSMEHIKKDLKVYRNYDFEFIKKLETDNCLRKIPVNINIFCFEKSIIFEIFDKHGNKSKMELVNNFEIAQKQEVAKNSFEKQFAKMGNTEFLLNEISINGENLPFIKINELNEIRRELVSKFVKEREKNYIVKKQQKTNQIEYFEKNLNYKNNIINEKAKSFYEKRGCNICEYGLEHNSQSDFKNKQVMITKYCLKNAFNLCKTKHQFREPFYLVDEFGMKYQLEFDCKNCQMKLFFGEKLK